MKFTFINFSREPRSGQPLGVHAAGCGDVARTVANRGPEGTAANNTWDVEAETLDAAIAKELAVFQADDMGFTENDFKIYPCCQKEQK